MNKKTGYVLSRVNFEYNDEGYDLGGLLPQSVYINYVDAEKAKWEASKLLAMSDSRVGEYCAAVDCASPSILHKNFPGVFDEWGYLRRKGPKWSDGHAEVTQEVAEFIATNFSLFDIQKVDIYE
jgi:hypothetical protein